jgi:hypothetical protein
LALSDRPFMAEDTDGECAMKWEVVGDEAHFQLGASRGSLSLEEISAGIRHVDRFRQWT